MPQGGIDPGEDPWPAALRELYEETNIRSVEKLGEIEEWLSYDIPREIVGQAWKGKYRGQTQKWYALRFTGNDSEIDIAHPAGGHEPEFVEWRWEPMQNLPDLVVPFKRPVYERVVKEFVEVREASSLRSALRQRRLQRLELIELVRELVALPIVGGVGDVFLGVLDLAGEHAAVELLERHRHVGEHGQARRAHLGKAAVDHDLQLARRRRNHQDARPQRRDQRRMPASTPKSPSVPGTST